MKIRAVGSSMLLGVALAMLPSDPAVRAQVPNNLGPPDPCYAVNLTPSYPQNANNPSITRNAGGGFNFSATSSITFDCTNSTVLPSGCGVCADTTWWSSVTYGGNRTYLTTLYASSGVAACGSGGNVANFTDRYSKPAADGLYYNFLFGYTPSSANPCPKDPADVQYAAYGSGTFQN